MEPEFQPYGLPHLTVIFLTIVLPFAAGRDRAAHKIARDSKTIIVAVLSAVLVLNYVVYLIFIRSRGIVDLAANAADATVRLGHVGRHRRDVDRKSALVRGRIFLGNWRHVASRSHAKPAIWFSRLAIHQLFYLAFRHYHRRGLPDVDSTIPAISDVDCAHVRVDGVLFCGDAHCSTG